MFLVIKILKDISSLFERKLNLYQRGILFVVVLVVLLGTYSCTYRFSNLTVNLRGLSSIAVESVYNTDSSATPHELIWLSMQEAIIKDGHLKLRSTDEADATVAVKVNELKIVPSGSVTTSALDTDPAQPASKDNPISTNSFLRLAQSYSYNANNIIILDATVQIYHLRTKHVIFERRYHFTEELSSLYNYHYPVYKEAVTHDVRKLADKLSYNTVRDFLFTN